MTQTMLACSYSGTVVCDGGDCTIFEFSAPVAVLELGLRWLHDRDCSSTNGFRLPPVGRLKNGAVLREGDVLFGDGTILRRQDSESIAYLELGLRWLHDRTKRHTFGSFLGEFFNGMVESYTEETCAMGLELGLRWLHDRAKDGSDVERIRKAREHWDSLPRP